MTQLMNAVVLTGHGGPEKLIYTQVPKPTPQKGEVLIKVGACSLNNADLNIRTGWYAAESDFQEILQDTKNNKDKTATWNQTSIQFPLIQGSDIVGEVVEIGEDVDPKILNQRFVVDPWIRAAKLAEYQYIGSEFDGGFAEYAVAPVTNIYPVRSSWSDVEVATLPCSYSTAENMLVKGRVDGSDTVLIMGASGGVGSALIQLSKLRGATVIAIVGHNPEKEKFVKELGADYVYYRDHQLTEHLEKHRITVYLDPVGGEYVAPLLKMLQIGGRYISCGAIAEPIIELDLRELIYKDLAMIGATRLQATVFQNLVNYLNQDLLKPVVAKTFPLTQIKEAQKFFQSKHFCGKVVIVPDTVKT